MSQKHNKSLSIPGIIRKWNFEHQVNITRDAQKALLRIMKELSGCPEGEVTITLDDNDNIIKVTRLTKNN